MTEAEFADVLLLSDAEPELAKGSKIRWRRIGPLRSRADYSRFMLRELAQHVATSHVLCVQWDGFVLRGEAWRPDFLECDYVGAVWPHFPPPYNVGNGGFSLRSSRLLKVCRELAVDEVEPEDLLISRVWRPALEARGLRFAPESLARRFSYERGERSGAEFGFHGAFNLVRLISNRDALQLFRSLEPAVLAPNEHLEIFRWAARRGRLELALTMLWRWLRGRR